MTTVQWVVIGWAVATVLLAVVWIRVAYAFSKLGNPKPPNRLHVVRSEEKRAS